MPVKPSTEKEPKPKPAPEPAAPSSSGPPPLLQEPASWQAVTPAHIDEIVFPRLPSDSGVVSPIARLDEPIDPEVETDLEEIRTKLATWGPGQIADPVQREVDRLRYAEEHAVRYGAVDLAERRNEVKRLIPLLRESAGRQL